MNCLNCNKEISDNSLFCPFCGTKVNNEANGNLIPLTITREKKLMGCAIPFSVFVDGVRVGDLKNGNFLQCSVGLGKHTVLIKCVEKDVVQDVVVLPEHHSVEVVTFAKMGLLAAIACIKNVIFK